MAAGTAAPAGDAPDASSSPGRLLRVAIPLPRDVAIGEPYLFPDQRRRRRLCRPAAFLARRRYGSSPNSQHKRGEPAQLRGRARAWRRRAGWSFRRCAGAVPEGGQQIGELRARARSLLAVLGAIAGGLLLNLMPCVFPILALKALHLARSGGDAARTRGAMRWLMQRARSSAPARSALHCSPSAPAEARRAGHSSCRTRARSCCCCCWRRRSRSTCSGCSNCRCWPERARPSGGFATGALAAFVATPCAGPFLGAALGTALLLPAAGSVLVFAALGLGLALPFLAIALRPGACASGLPKPGPWMVRLQRFLAIPMAATAARLPVAALSPRRASRAAIGLGTIAAMLSALGCSSGAVSVTAQGQVDDVR